MLSTYSDRLPAFAVTGTIVLALCLSGCASKPATPENAPVSAQGVQTIKEKQFFGFLTPYRIDVQQGNFVSSEAMTQLQDGLKRSEGMTREQVRFLLGTPLIADVFHADRWDYVFRLRRGDGEVLTSHVTVIFKGNKLDKIDGTTNLPTEKDYISLIAENDPAKNTPAK